MPLLLAEVTTSLERRHTVHAAEQQSGVSAGVIVADHGADEREEHIGRSRRCARPRLGISFGNDEHQSIQMGLSSCEVHDRHQGVAERDRRVERARSDHAKSISEHLPALDGQGCEEPLLVGKVAIRGVPRDASACTHLAQGDGLGAPAIKKLGRSGQQRLVGPGGRFGTARHGNQATG